MFFYKTKILFYIEIMQMFIKNISDNGEIGLQKNHIIFIFYD